MSSARCLTVDTGIVSWSEGATEVWNVTCLSGKSCTSLRRNVSVRVTTGTCLWELSNMSVWSSRANAKRRCEMTIDSHSWRTPGTHALRFKLGKLVSA